MNEASLLDVTKTHTHTFQPHWPMLLAFLFNLLFLFLEALDESAILALHTIGNAGLLCHLAWLALRERERAIAASAPSSRSMMLLGFFGPAAFIIALALVTIFLG